MSFSSTGSGVAAYPSYDMVYEDVGYDDYRAGFFEDSDAIDLSGIGDTYDSKEELKQAIKHRFRNATFLNPNYTTRLLGHIYNEDGEDVPVVLNGKRILLRVSDIGGVEVFIHAPNNTFEYMRPVAKMLMYKSRYDNGRGGRRSRSRSRSSSSSSSSVGKRGTDKIKKYGTLYNPRSKRCVPVYEKTSTGELYKYVTGRGGRKLHKLKHTEVERVEEGRLTKTSCNNLKKEYYREKPGCNGTLTCKKYGIMYKKDTKRCVYVYENPSGDLYKVVRNSEGKRKYRKLTDTERRRVIKARKNNAVNCKKSKKAGGYSFNFGCGCGAEGIIV
jgi:hypothetical protein